MLHGIEHEAQYADVTKCALRTLSDAAGGCCAACNQQNTICNAGQIDGVGYCEGWRGVDDDPGEVLRERSDQLLHAVVSRQFRRLSTIVVSGRIQRKSGQRS